MAEDPQEDKEDPANKETLGTGRCLPPFIIILTLLITAVFLL
jgi:hypothetical protein